MSNSIATRDLSDEQRRKLVALIVEDPWRGLTRAARVVGVTGSKGEIGKLLKADDRFQDALHDARGDTIDQVQSLRVANLFKKLGSIAENDESSSQFRAIQFGLGLRGIGVTEHAHLAVTGGSGGPVEVRVEHDHESAGRLLRKLADVGLIQPGPAAAPYAEAQRVLPPPSD